MFQMLEGLWSSKRSEANITSNGIDLKAQCSVTLCYYSLLCTTITMSFASVLSVVHSGNMSTIKKGLPLLSESLLRQNATTAAESKPTEAKPALPAPWLSSQYWFLLRPRLARAAQERRRLSRFDSHFGARWWYCTKEFTFVPAVLSPRIPLLETREVDTTVLRWMSPCVSRMPWQVRAFTSVCKTRVFGDKLRDLRTISLAGTDDNMATSSLKWCQWIKTDGFSKWQISDRVWLRTYAFQLLPVQTSWLFFVCGFSSFAVGKQRTTAWPPPTDVEWILIFTQSQFKNVSKSCLEHLFAF